MPSDDKVTDVMSEQQAERGGLGGQDLKPAHSGR